MTLGQLIILEGPDGAGKSSTAKVLVERMRSSGRPTHLFAFPGNEPETLGHLVHDLHHQPFAHGVRSIDATSLQVLHAAAHIDAIYTRIRPALERGDTIIMDRFWWSTIIYGRVTGVDQRTLELLEQLARHHWNFVVPTAAFVLMGAKEQTVDVKSAASQLRHAYCDFIANPMNATFPVYSFDYVEGTTPYPNRILDKLSELHQSSSI